MKPRPYFMLFILLFYKNYFRHFRQSKSLELNLNVFATLKFSYIKNFFAGVARVFFVGINFTMSISQVLFFHLSDFPNVALLYNRAIM